MPMVNLMFVVALISLVYAMMQHYSGKNALQAKVTGNRNFIKTRWRQLGQIPTYWCLPF